MGVISLHSSVTSTAILFLFRQKVKQITRFLLQPIICAAKESQKLTTFDNFIAPNRRTNRLNQQRKEIFAIWNLVDQIKFRQIYFLVRLLLCIWKSSWQEEFLITGPNRVHVDVGWVESAISIASSSATKSFHVILQFSLHNATNSDNVTTDARIDQIILYFTIYCLGHFTSVDIFDVIVDFLHSKSLEKGCFCGVFLGIENTTTTVSRNAPIRRFPLSVDKGDLNLGFALMTCKLDRLYENLDWRNSQHCASQGHKFVDQVRLNLRKGS